MLSSIFSNEDLFSGKQKRRDGWRSRCLLLTSIWKSIIFHLKLLTLDQGPENKLKTFQTYEIESATNIILIPGTEVKTYIQRKVMHTYKVRGICAPQRPSLQDYYSTIQVTRALLRTPISIRNWLPRKKSTLKVMNYVNNTNRSIRLKLRSRYSSRTLKFTVSWISQTLL